MTNLMPIFLEREDELTEDVFTYCSLLEEIKTLTRKRIFKVSPEKQERIDRDVLAYESAKKDLIKRLGKKIEERYGHVIGEQAFFPTTRYFGHRMGTFAFIVVQLDKTWSDV